MSELMPNTNMSIYQLALESNIEHMDQIAIDVRSNLNDYEQTYQITYQEYFEQIRRDAGAMSALGIKRNEVVPMILPNIPEFRSLIYANSMIGAISFPISPMAPANQINEFVNNNNIKKIFFFSSFYEKFKPLLCNTNLTNVIYIGSGEGLPSSHQMISWTEYK